MAVVARSPVPSPLAALQQQAAQSIPSVASGGESCEAHVRTCMHALGAKAGPAAAPRRTRGWLARKHPAGTESSPAQDCAQGGREDACSFRDPFDEGR